MTTGRTPINKNLNEIAPSWICFIDYTEVFDCIDHNTAKLLKTWEYQTILPVSWETHMPVKKQQLETCMEQLTGSGQMVTTAMKLKELAPWKESYNKPRQCIKKQRHHSADKHLYS